MDESPSEAMNFINEEKSRENSSGLEAVPWQKKVNNPDSDHGVCVFHLDLKKYSQTCETPVLSRTHLLQEITSPAEERDLHYILPSPIQYRQFIRRNVRLEETAFHRECKKLEKVWTNRGLPVDRESLCSAASKDAFDLKGLSESLPSTSDSEKKPSVTEFRRISPKMQNIERFETLRYHIPRHYNYTPRERRLFTGERFPASETIPALCNSLKGSLIKDAMLRRSLGRSQRLIRWKRIYSWKRICNQFPPSELEKQFASDEQIESIEERRNSDAEKALQNWPRLASEFAGMSPDDKQEKKREEKQNIDVENNQQSIGLAPLPRLHQDVGQCSSWEPERNWTTDFHFPDIRVPLNSPNKKEVNIDKNDPFLSMGKVMADIRQSSMILMRAESKWRTLNSLRGELSLNMDESVSEKPSSKEALPSNMDESESEKPSSKEVLPSNLDESESEKPSSKEALPSIHDLLDSIKETDDLLLRKLGKGRRIRNMKESFKSFRSLQSRFLLGSVKSDKVVPD